MVKLCSCESQPVLATYFHVMADKQQCTDGRAGRCSSCSNGRAGTMADGAVPPVSVRIRDAERGEASQAVDWWWSNIAMLVESRYCPVFDFGSEFGVQHCSTG